MEAQTSIETRTAGVSWAAIAAGAVTAAALTLVLAAFGAGLGLSSISPWADSGASATGFKIGAGVYLCVVAVMASSVGGYLAARLRTKWTGLHTNEAYFRDSAHGLIAWAFATLLSATVLATATTHILSGAALGAGVATSRAANPVDLYVDKLFRAESAAQPGPAAGGQPVGNTDAVRSETSRLWTSGFRENGDLNADNRAYVARLVAARTGLSQTDAEKRVNDTITEAKAAADRARKAAAQLSFWLTASLLLGAFAASLAAIEGGLLRDGTWNDRVLTPRTI